MKNLLTENTKKSRKFVRRSVYLPFILVGIVVIGLAFFLLKATASQTASAGMLPSNNAGVSKPTAQVAINKTMNFPLKDDEGKEIAKLKYEILSAELRDQIIVKGQKATAIDGRTFLIVSVKITNDYDKPVELRVRDYIRLVKKGSDEKNAPEIHNDPTEVQASSTKYTRVGFPINKTDKDMNLIVGEIGGKKEEIKLNF